LPETLVLQLEGKNREAERLDGELWKRTSNLQELVNTELWDKNREIENLENVESLAHDAKKQKGEAELQIKTAKKKMQ
jgi:hypothetical protein